MVQRPEYTLCIEAMHGLKSGKEVTEGALEAICCLHDSKQQLYKAVNPLLVLLEKDPIFSVLDLDLKEEQNMLKSPQHQHLSVTAGSKQSPHLTLLDFAFKAMKEQDNPRVK